MNERGEATEGDKRVRVVHHVEQAVLVCKAGFPDCRNANVIGDETDPDTLIPVCCGQICWPEIESGEGFLTLPSLLGDKP